MNLVCAVSGTQSNTSYILLNSESTELCIFPVYFRVTTAGSIPPELGSLSALQVLKLGDELGGNKLSGGPPTSILIARFLQSE